MDGALVQALQAIPVKFFNDIASQRLTIEEIGAIALVALGKIEAMQELIEREPDLKEEKKSDDW